jgi:hypothetical protein
MSLSFSGLTTSPYIASNSAVSSVELTKKLIFYGFSNNTSGAISGISSLFAESDAGVSTTYWTIKMVVQGTGSSASAAYTIYYYGI